MPDPERHQINVYLFDSTVNDFGDAVSKKVNANAHIPVSQVAGFDVRLYTKLPRSAKRPKWMDLIATGIANANDDPFKTFKKRTPSAALIIRKGSRFMAITFGQGRHLINLGALVKRFGLTVALNLAPPELRSIQTKTHAEFTQTKAVTNSKVTGLSRFGYDSEEDLLIQVSAKLAKNKNWGYSISGKDVIHIVADVTFESLPRKADHLARVYAKDWRKKKFPEVASLEPIDNVGLLHSLNGAMCTSLMQPNHDGFHLSPYEVVLESDESAGFAGSYDLGPDDPVTELELSRFISESGFSGPQDFQLLRSNSVYVKKADGSSMSDPWSVYDCLVGNVTHLGITYGLSGGVWISPELDYVTRLNTAVGALADDPALAGLNAIGVKSETALIDAAIAQYALGDAQVHPRSIGWNGGRNMIEFADAIGDKRLIIAKLNGSARDTSHLLSQAANSVKALAAKDFRDVARAKYANSLPAVASWIPMEQPSLSEWTMVVLIGTEYVRPFDQWPIIQRIALKRLIDELAPIGIKLLVHQTQT